jgi:tetratricopeptide (TPR) repeat protein
VTVIDPGGAPVQGARLIVSDPTSASFRMEAASDRKGRATLLGLAPRAYNFRVEKEGHQAYESNFEAHAGETTKKEVVLRPLEAGAEVRPGAAGAPAEVVEKQTLPWAVAYNEAVPLYAADRDDEAAAKLDAALAAKADYAPALALKGIILEEHGRCGEAVPFLKEGHALDPNVRSALGPLVRCLDRLGLEDEAAVYRKLQARSGRSKTDLYNDAVVELNEGDDAAAAPLLEQALAQDEAYAPAQYQYGLILFRRGDVAGAVARLETYLRLAPSGEFASDARDLLKALKP